MSLLPQSGPVRAGLLSLVLGAAYLAVSGQYARLVYAAPRPTDERQLSTVLETVLTIPAIAFTIIGLGCFIYATTTLIERVSNSR